jgi:hypothetical protein
MRSEDTIFINWLYSSTGYGLFAKKMTKEGKNRSRTYKKAWRTMHIKVGNHLGNGWLTISF